MKTVEQWLRWLEGGGSVTATTFREVLFDMGILECKLEQGKEDIEKAKQVFLRIGEVMGWPTEEDYDEDSERVV